MVIKEKITRHNRVFDRYYLGAQDVENIVVPGSPTNNDALSAGREKDRETDAQTSLSLPLLGSSDSHWDVPFFPFPLSLFPPANRSFRHGDPNLEIYSVMDVM